MSISFLPLLLALSQGGAPLTSQPIQLQLDVQQSKLVLRVVGKASEPASARYVLETDIAGNRARQSGTARLVASRPVDLINLDVSRPTGANWRVRLSVTLDDGTTYDVERSSAEEA